MEEKITRRGFLAGAGIAAASAAAMSLASCSPSTSTSTATTSDGAAATDGAAASTTSGGTMGYDGTGTMPWLGEAPAITDADVEETLDCDVLVIGLGCAGVPAARSAAESGAKVIAIEASSQLNSCASDMAILGGETQALWGRGDGFLDPKTIINMHMEEGSHRSSYGIIKRWTEESGKALDWFLEADSDLYICDKTYDLEVPEANQGDYFFPYFVPIPDTYDYTKEDMPCYPTSVGFSSLATVMQKNLDAATNAGAEVRYDTRGIELITDDSGAVIGAYAQAVDSEKYIQINCKSVIIATGDYLMNEDMMKYFSPSTIENGNGLLSMDMDKNGNYTNVGDGHKMGVWAGAALEAYHAPVIHHMGGGAGADGRGVIGNNGYLWLNKAGVRFMNEDIPGQQLENQVELQKDRTAFQFFDANWPQQLEYFPAAHGVACYYRDEALPDWCASGLKINVRCPDDIQTSIDNGLCFTADTIDDLLAQLDGIDVDAAKQSIEDYNALCAAGEDTQFYKSSQRLFPLDTPPYYAAVCGVALSLANLGGFVSDGDCQVYNTDHEPIPGLYVCGAPQGGRFNVQYPISMKGLSASMCMVFGKIAGENAASTATA